MASEAVAIAALLYYFGWARANQAFQYYGIDVGTLGFSTTDYILRGVSTVVPAIVVSAVLAVCSITVHRLFAAPWLSRWTAAQRTRLSWGLWGIGGLLLFPSALWLIAPAWLDGRLGYGLPLSLAASAGVVAYGRAVAAMEDERFSYEADIVPSLLALLAVTGLVWALALYGVQSGWSAARSYAADLSGKSEVTVWSEKRLSIRGPGVVATNLDAGASADVVANSAFHYRYEGLRLIVRGPDGLLLVPWGWRRGIDAVVMLAPDDSIRIDVIAR
ncbi:hypothetical protein [Cryptosporangium arvum]|uniref:Uncharacterized protein n=1 Tax=Cryptosporangium arvum DSM 44712 TaxID=927661 RepID=A0A010ZTK5_9ACTN|nr:hypothetical protein [Cryptosporangium arvum]EXG82034.1 hypothetical protein CryarDRAFT_3166 [Cryptosporangium arvum DSM 44712]